MVSAWPAVKTRCAYQHRGQGWVKRNWHSSLSLGGGGKWEFFDRQSPQREWQTATEQPALAAERGEEQPRSAVVSFTGLGAENPKVTGIFNMSWSPGPDFLFITNSAFVMPRKTSLRVFPWEKLLMQCKSPASQRRVQSKFQVLPWDVTFPH